MAFWNAYNNTSQCILFVISAEYILHDLSSKFTITQRTIELGERDLAALSLLCVSSLHSGMLKS